MYVVRIKDVYVTVEPTLNYANDLAIDPYLSPVCFAWTCEKASAVRFTTRWHAHAVARALKKRGGPGGIVVRVPS